MNLYADLSSNRNLLWKSTLELEFPIEFLFSQLACENLSIELRSAFCRLAFSLYVDQEPLNYLKTPNLCRFLENKEILIKKQIKKKKEGYNSPEKTSLLDNMVSKNLFEFLNTETSKYLAKEKMKINEKLINKYSSNNNEKIDPVLNNSLTFELLKLSVSLIKFNIIAILDETDQYSEIVQNLLVLFEFEEFKPEISYSLMKFRGF